LLCGYRAVDLLLRRAAGDAVGDVRWSAMRQGLDDVQLPPETVSAILSARDGDYPAQGSALLETAGEAIKARWGEAVYSSFVIGVHIRVIERLLAGDAESFARQDAAEARRSIVFIQKNAQTAGYPPPILETVKELAATLAIKPEYEAVRQSRQLWSSLVRTLDDFNEAVKLMPSPPTQSVGEAAPVGQ
jgi:hypothetical protein